MSDHESSYTAGPDPATRAREIVDVWERTAWYGADAPQVWMVSKEEEGLVAVIAVALAERDAALAEARPDRERLLRVYDASMLTCQLIADGRLFTWLVMPSPLHDQLQRLADALKECEAGAPPEDSADVAGRAGATPGLQDRTSQRPAPQEREGEGGG